MELLVRVLQYSLLVVEWLMPYYRTDIFNKLITKASPTFFRKYVLFCFYAHHLWKEVIILKL